MESSILDRVVIDSRSSTVEGWMKTLLWKAQSAGEPATICILGAGSKQERQVIQIYIIYNPLQLPLHESEGLRHDAMKEMGTGN